LIPFLRIFKKPIIVTVHGLDITYKNKSYQAIIPKKIALADRVVCVSRATAGECLKRNIPEEKICIVPNGIKDEFYLAGGRGNLKAALERKLKINIGNKKVLLSVGRLIERKGIHWFIKEIVPKIKADCADFVYLVAGCGKMAEDIRAIIKNNALENWVVMVGEVSDEELKILYNAADIFVMPNIPVAGDFEGFGIVILEAASCGLAVVASDMEGIRDALGDGDWGVLIEPLNAAKFSGEILNLMRDDDRRANLATRARAGVIDVFNWPGVAQKYLDIFNETSSIMKLARYSGPS
jgi:glycosyltransferase involved in cell wall biosynthesis